MESADVDSSVRKEHNISLVDSILQQYLGISTKIEKAMHTSWQACTDKFSMDKPRLLKITVSSEHDKAKILRTCTRLSHREIPQEIQKLLSPPISPLVNKK